MNRDEIHQWLLDEFARGFSQSVAAMTGQPVEANPAEPEPPADGDPLWWRRCGLPGIPDGAVWVGAPQTSWRRIGGEALKGVGTEEPEPADVRSTYLEILQQAVSALCTALTAKLGREVLRDTDDDGEPAGAPTRALQFNLGAASPATVLFAASEAVVSALEQSEASSGRPETAGAEQAPPPAAAASRALNQYDLLLDVEMPVSVSFGRSNLPLRDVLRLSSGSIVELNRTVTEPVEIIVNNCVIARGEVVVVDGNYGVRIQQVIPRSDRLRTLY